jgi:hypothetical protein
MTTTVLFAALAALAVAQSDNVALRGAEHAALQSFWTSLGCVDERCPSFQASQACPAASGSLMCANGSVVAIDLFSDLTGSINGSALGVLTGLTFLRLLSLALTTIPTQIGQLTALMSLILESSTLTGALPAQVADMSSLQELSVASNQLTGTLPSRLVNLTRLASLTTRNNVGLGGRMPAMPSTIRALNVQSCSFTVLPPNLNQLKLSVLLLDRNNFTGTPALSSYPPLCTLQIVGDTNCFDCPQLGVGLCECSSKNATCPVEITAETTAASLAATATQFSTTATAAVVVGTTTAASTTATAVLVVGTTAPPASSPSYTLIGGAVGGSVALLLLIGTLIVCVMRRRKMRPTEEEPARAEPERQISHYNQIPESNYALAVLPASPDYDHGNLS